MGYRYIVQACFENREVAAEWLDWLRDGHCQEVLDGGATAVEIVDLDSVALTFEVRYEFPDQETFTSYEKVHAPRLREEGLARFPVSRGVRYARSTGTVIFSQ